MVVVYHIYLFTDYYQSGLTDGLPCALVKNGKRYTLYECERVRVSEC